jgi:RNA polymerase sigma factor (sigma-70 family)
MMEGLRNRLLYHFCRVQFPDMVLPYATFEKQLHRAFAQFQAKQLRTGSTVTWDAFLGNLHAADWYLCCACLEGQAPAWEYLFGARVSRSDSLLVDALRTRAVRLFPRDPERQERAVEEYWGYLLAGEKPGSPPILARYDGQRPLVPWLIRVFQNKHISELRQARGLQPLPEDELEGHHFPPVKEENDGRWHEAFRLAARDWLSQLDEGELLILGLRFRYRLSQRQVAGLLRIHEGNISRQTSRLRDRCLDYVARRLTEQGWTGEDLGEFLRTEMDSIILDEPRGVPGA